MSTEKITVAVNGVFLQQPVTGVQRYARELLGALIQSGNGRYRFRVITPGHYDSNSPQAIPGLEDVVEDRTRLPHALWVQLGLPRVFRRLGAALLWSPTNTGPLSIRNQILTIHDVSVFVEPRWFSRLFGLYYRSLLPRLASRVKTVLTMSEFSRDELVRLGIAPASKIEILPCGVSPDFHPRTDLGEWDRKRPYLLAVGSRNPRKNLATLLRAWTLLPPSTTSGRRLLVAGAGAPIYRRELPANMGGIPDGVEFLGFVPDRSLPELYAGAEGLVFPSLYEGFGLPPLEAMACGTPALVSRAASLPEVCGEAAIYCDPRDPEEMAQKMELLFNDRELRARLGEEGRSRSRKFTWERAARGMLSVMDRQLA